MKRIFRNALVISLILYCLLLYFQVATNHATIIGITTTQGNGMEGITLLRQQVLILILMLIFKRRLRAI